MTEPKDYELPRAERREEFDGILVTVLFISAISMAIGFLLGLLVGTL